MHRRRAVLTPLNTLPCLSCTPEIFWLQHWACSAPTASAYIFPATRSAIDIVRVAMIIHTQIGAIKTWGSKFTVLQRILRKLVLSILKLRQRRAKYLPVSTWRCLAFCLGVFTKAFFALIKAAVFSCEYRNGFAAPLHKSQLTRFLLVFNLPPRAYPILQPPSMVATSRYTHRLPMNFDSM